MAGKPDGSRSDDARTESEASNDAPSEEASESFDALLRAVAAAPDVPLSSRTRMSVLPEEIVGDTYRIEEILAEGAMGVVFVATDLALDRRVALKLHASNHDDPTRSRMWREAKAMARLAHPNVITVYDVGVHAGRVYIAMELVEGPSLKAWLQQPRPWRTVLDVFVQAARGLAAAHGVGLVHRDFKPSNVLLGPDGRARVADFGLARALSDPAPETTGVGLSTGSEESPSLDARVTRTGTRVGTPAYMAPEQRAGKVADARSDQFAFFVSLHEGLFGVRPAVGDSRTDPDPAPEIAARQTGSTRRVPAWLQSICRRGLSLDPEARFLDMEAVIAALGRDPTPRRRAMLAVGAGALALGGVVAGRAMLEQRARDDCATRADAIDETWNDARGSTLRVAFAATGSGYADSAVDRMTPLLDDHVAQWKQAFVQGCERGEVDAASDEQARALWAASQACLQTRADELDALLTALSQDADAARVRDAVFAAGGLRALGQCTNRDWLARHPAAVQTRASQERTELRRAGALMAAGRYAEGKAVADAVLAAVATDDGQLRAAAAVMVGELALEVSPPEQAVEALTEGFELAVAAGDDDRALEAATELVYAVGVLQRRPEPGLWWATTARALVKRLDAEDDWVAAMLHGNVGMVHEAAGQLEAALAEHERSLSILQRVDPASVEVAYNHNNLGTTYTAMGRYEDAERELTRGVSILEAALGPDHPQVAIGFNNLGSLYNRQARLEDAERAHLRALESFSRGLSPEHPLTAGSHNNLGSLYSAMGRLDEAQEHLERALAILERAEGPDEPGLARVHNHLGNVALDRYLDHYGADPDPAHLEAAERHHARALAIATEGFGPGDHRVAVSRNNLGRVRVAQGRLDDAEDAFSAALEIWREARGADHPDTARAHENLGALHRRRGEPSRAMQAWKEALRILAGSLPPDHPRVVHAREQAEAARAEQAESQAPAAGP